MLAVQLEQLRVNGFLYSLAPDETVDLAYLGAF